MIKSFLLLFFITTYFGASSQSQQSFLLENACKAMQILSKTIDAMGGKSNLDSLKVLKREMWGIGSEESQQYKPYLNNDGLPGVISHPYHHTILDFAKQRGLSFANDTLVNTPYNFVLMASDTLGFIADINKHVYRKATSPAQLIAYRLSIFRRYPETLVLNAWNRREDLRWIGSVVLNDKKNEVLSFADIDGAQVTFYIDSHTFLVTKQESIFADRLMGDQTTAIEYDDWKPAGKLVLPYIVRDRLNNNLSREFKIQSIIFEQYMPDSVFKLNPGFIDYTSGAQKVEKLADGVYVITGSFYKSVFVEFKDFVLVLEGVNSAHIALIKSTIPSKPIKYVVYTHSHYDHLLGLRGYLTEGAEIITTDDVTKLIERKALKTKHLIRPDNYANDPRPAKIETVKNKKVITDGNRTVELYDIGPNPHANQILIAWLPKEEILFQGDLLDLDVAPGIKTTGGDETKDFAAKLKLNNIYPRLIIPVHGRIGSMDDLNKVLKAIK